MTPKQVRAKFKTVHEFAQYTGYHRNSLHGWLYAGRIPIRAQNHLKTFPKLADLQVSK